VLVGTKVYCMPSLHDHAAVVEVANAPRSISAYEVEVSAAAAYRAGATGSQWDGVAVVGTKIYATPHAARAVLVIEVITDEVSVIAAPAATNLEPTDGPGTEGWQKWRGAAVVGTTVYAAPYFEPYVLEVDTLAATAAATLNSSAVVLDSGGFCEPRRRAPSLARFTGATALGTKVYFAPAHADCVLVLETVLRNLTGIEVAASAYRGTAAIPHDFSPFGVIGTRLFAAPRKADGILGINGEDDTILGWYDTTHFESEGSLAHKWGSFTAVDGRLFATAVGIDNAAGVLVLNPGTDASAEAEWSMFENFCVADDGTDLTETQWPAGDASREVCKAECKELPSCSAFEFFPGVTDCRLLLTSTPAVRGDFGARLDDAECHVKPRVLTTPAPLVTAADLTGWHESSFTMHRTLQNTQAGRPFTDGTLVYACPSGKEDFLVFDPVSGTWVNRFVSSTLTEYRRRNAGGISVAASQSGRRRIAPRRRTGTSRWWI
jgi:hypothetical protein